MLLTHLRRHHRAMRMFRWFRAIDMFCFSLRQPKQDDWLWGVGWKAKVKGAWRSSKWRVPERRR
jgi:hypothetical protein